VVESSRATLLSTVARLRLEYSPGTDEQPPARLFLKASHPDPNPELVASSLKEVAFYETVAPLMPPAIVPHCYDVALDPGASIFHLLLEDLAETHFIVTEWPLPPTVEQCERIIEAYALLHSFFRTSSSAERIDQHSPAQPAPRRAISPRAPGRPPWVLDRTRESLEMVRLGTLDFVLCGVAHVSRFVPEMGTLVLPYLWKDTDTMFVALDGRMGQTLEPLLPSTSTAAT
jgi:hypothetical protein